VPQSDLTFEGAPGRALLGVVTKAVESRWDAARAAARRTEGRTVGEKVEVVTARFARQLAALGAAAGGTATVPGVGTIAVLSTTSVELGAFAFRAAEMILTIGAAHGHTEADTHERTAWVLAVLAFGGSAANELGQLRHRLGSGAAADAVAGGRSRWFENVNQYLGRKLVTRWGARRGASVLGKAVPFGIGAGFGAATNYVVARRIARNADRFFAGLPRQLGSASWPMGQNAAGDSSRDVTAAGAAPVDAPPALS
jgi:hypothetical protein